MYSDAGYAKPSEQKTVGAPRSVQGFAPARRSEVTEFFVDPFFCDASGPEGVKAEIDVSADPQGSA